MKIKYILTVLLLVIFNLFSFAQEEKEQFKDVVYLINGKKMKGHIIDYKIGESLKIKLKNGRIFTIKESIIKKVEFYRPGSATDYDYGDEYGFYKKNADDETAYEFKERGLVGNFSLVIMPGKNNVQYSSGSYRPYNVNGTGYNINIGLAYRFSRPFALGGGMGISTFGFGLEEYFMPLYFDVSSILKDRRISPFIKLKAGYGFIVSTANNVLKSNGGLYLNPVLGIKKSTRSAVDFIIGIGYTYQKAYFEHGFPGPYGTVKPPVYHHDITFNRININLGVYF